MGVSLGFGVEPAPAESIVATQDNSVYCNPSDTDWVEPNGDTLTVRHEYSASYSRKAWVQFDLSEAQYNSDAGATFFITLSGLNFTPSSSDILVVSGLKSGFVSSPGMLGTDWSENAVTWSNAPGNHVSDSWCLDTNVTLEIDQLVNLSAGQVLEFAISDIGDYVQAGQYGHCDPCLEIVWRWEGV